jgi:hypothetical protein
MIPRHHWIVLEPEQDHTMSSASLECNDGGFSGRTLAKALGGGVIPEERVLLLRLVPEERLHVVAAEANFKRASRSTSILALRHAAYAIELLSQRDRETTTGAMSVPLESCPSSTGFLDEHLFARLTRMSQVVKAAAVAAKHRPAPGEIIDKKAPAITPRRNSAQSLLLKGNGQLQRGVTCLEEFMAFIHRRYGNSVRAWFALDPEENMLVGEKYFIKRVLEMGFTGEVTALYKYIDSDRSGCVSILELDAAAAIALAEFKKFIDRQFDGSTDRCFQWLDRNRHGRFCSDDMVHCLGQLSYDGRPAELFDLLDRQGHGFVVLQDLAFLKKWKPRPFLFVKPDENILRHIKEGFCLVHGTPLWRTWRNVLDVDCTMRVSWDEFAPAVKKLVKQCAVKFPGHTVPHLEEDVAAAWRALDEDCGGYVTLKEWDRPCFEVLRAFKEWAIKEHGGCVAAMKKLDANGNARLNSWELRQSESRPNAYPGDVDAVFDYLDLANQKSLGEPEVKFIDEWDIEWEEFEEYSRGRLKAANFEKTPPAASSKRPQPS